MIHFSIIKFAKIFDGPGLVQGVKSRGGFRGGGGSDAPPPLRDSTSCRPKGLPFVLF